MSGKRELVDALAVANEDRALLRAALEDANGRLSKAQREQGETERWLRNLERSRSWKLTRPLRDAGATYRSLSRRLRSRSARRV
jgi:hypothetical protein